MSEEITIVPVATKKDLKLFIRFPWTVYRGEKTYENWVPPLLLGEKDLFDKNKDPFYKHADMQLFLAYKGGKLSGRIAAIVDYAYIDYQKDESGFFGFFEALEDQDVSDALFRAAENWVKEKGYSSIKGPMNPTTGKTIGCLIDSYDIPPIIEMPYNAEYYPPMIEKSGYGKSKDLFCYRMDKELKLSDKMLRVADIVKKRHNISIRRMEMKQWDVMLDIVRDIYNDAWADNWGFVPWTKEELDHIGKDLKLVINPELALLAYMGDKPVAFTLPILDLNQILIKMNGRLLPDGLFKLLLGRKKIDMIRVAILGVRKEAQNKGIDAVLVKEIYETGVRLGMKGSELSWILEDNINLTNLLENWGAEHYRTYRIYEKTI